MNLLLSEEKNLYLCLVLLKRPLVASGYYQVGKVQSQSVKLLIVLISLFISKD